MMISKCLVFVFCLTCIITGGMNFVYADDEVKMEHYAIAASLDYLDGPRLETLGSDKGRISCNDKEGNIFFMWKYSAAWIRCITLDGQVKTIGGDDRWPTDLNLTEGPASYFPNQESGPGAGQTCVPEFGITADGLPLQGEDKGCLYVYWGKKCPYRIWKSKTHGGRWWMKRLGAPGKAKPPKTNGESAMIADVDLTNARVGNGWMSCNGNMYTFDSVKGEITCVLTLADYESKVNVLLGKNRTGQLKNVGAAEQLALADDGSIYLLYYLKNYPTGCLFRIPADRSKVELIVQQDKNALAQNIDGPGVGTKWHCGPAWMRLGAGDTVMLRAIDSATARRWRNGRVATLCFDGEWREKTETTKRGSLGALNSSGYQPADHGLPYVFVHYAGEQSKGDCRFFKFGPVDFTKPTVGPLARIKGK